MPRSLCNAMVDPGEAQSIEPDNRVKVAGRLALADHDDGTAGLEGSNGLQQACRFRVRKGSERGIEDEDGRALDQGAASVHL